MERRHTTEARVQRRRFILGLVLLFATSFTVIGYFVTRGSVDVFSSTGPIAARERALIIFAAVLSSIVIIPVFILTGFIAYRYRETNHHAKYSPDFDHSVLFESIWWGIPIAIIGTLAVVTWRSSHSLDPRAALVSNKTPLTIQVVALQWRWLFLYPEQGVASMNYVEMPVNRPVRFEITSDAPMNSFWLPKLGGQIYAMSGMETRLNLMASQTGNYRGVSANISGDGFADMVFTARAVPPSQFDSWAQDARNSKALTGAYYRSLSRPSDDNKPATFNLQDTTLFHDILMSYMGSSGGTH
jgi:cytochrome o ubiquinol oxidase subunit 2